MGALMWWRSFGVGLLLVVTSGGPGAAGQVLLKNRVVTCVATSPNIVRMWVEGVGMALDPNHSSAHARIHLQLRDKSQLTFSLSGAADRIDKDLSPNSGKGSINYAGVACTVFHRNLTSVHECRGTAGKRTCEVGLDLHGERRAYLVSLSIKPAQ